MAQVVAQAGPLGQALAGAQAKGLAHDLEDEGPLFARYKGSIE